MKYTITYRVGRQYGHLTQWAESKAQAEESARALHSKLLVRERKKIEYLEVLEGDLLVGPIKARLDAYLADVKRRAPQWGRLRG